MYEIIFLFNIFLAITTMDIAIVVMVQWLRHPPLMHEVVDLKPGKYQCDFFNSYVLSKLILNIIDIGEGKHRDDTWTCN